MLTSHLSGAVMQRRELPRRRGRGRGGDLPLRRVADARALKVGGQLRGPHLLHGPREDVPEVGGLMAHT